MLQSAKGADFAPLGKGTRKIWAARSGRARFARVLQRPDILVNRYPGTQEE
jgi:hypothetical protein